MPSRHVALMQLLDRFQEAEKRALQDNREGPPADLRRELEAAYWQEVTQVVEAFVRDELPKDIAISEEDRLFLSFAVFDHPRLAEAVVRVALWQPPANDEFQLQFLHDALRAAYRDALRLETIAKLRQKLDAIDHELEQWPDVNLEYVKY